MIAKICFLIAGIIWAAEGIPQVIKTFQCKRVEDISLFYFLLCFFGFIAFFLGCATSKQWILFMSHIIAFINVTAILAMIFKYRKK